ncbi:FAD-dependent monooxygenase [Microbacterium sp. LWO14-1.2]|uniref:FAD binding domain-containing protein n=1 Tax=Microbacterium sp. LWO14-1.2 TaxID=3135263 RepID=UPI00313928A0
MSDFSASAHRIAVAGGSIGGLFAAAMLHRLGHDVTVYEESVHGLRTRGAGLVAQDEIFTALDAAGVPPATVPGVTSVERITLDLRGAIRYRERAEQTQLSWDRLYDGLRGVIPDSRYVLDSPVTGVRAGVDVISFTAGNERYETDLLVGADGAHSHVRRFIAPGGGEPAYVGYAIWRGLIPEDLVPAGAADTLFRRMTFYTGPGEHALGYLVAGPEGQTQPGSRRYNWVWYRSMSSEDLSTLMAASGRSSTSTSLAPGQTPADVTTQLSEAARHRLPPQFAEVIAMEPRPFLQGVLDYVAPRLVRDRAVLLGDAAAVVRPHTAMGASKAAGDALALTRALHSSPIGAALVSYSEQRLPVARDIARYGMSLGEQLPL